MAMSPDGMRDAILRNLRKRTGKNLEQWVRVAGKRNLASARELRSWLKTEHGLGSTTCGLIADATFGVLRRAPLPDSELLASQYRGDRAALRPTYDRLVREVRALGCDVRIGVRKTQTTFARRHTFAIAKAPTRTRIDLGLRLPGVKPTRRLTATTAFSENATHCVRLLAPQDVDGPLKKWLRAAYDARA